MAAAVRTAAVARVIAGEDSKYPLFSEVNMSNCRICKRLVASVSVTVVGTVLVVNIPDRSYNNCQKLCLLIAQEIPTTATRGMPVVITIGTDTTQYPLVRCNGNPVTQEYIG